MASGFGFPMLSSVGIAPAANLCPDDIAKPQSDLLPAVLSRFLASSVNAPSSSSPLDTPSLTRHSVPHSLAHSYIFAGTARTGSLRLASWMRWTTRSTIRVLYLCNKSRAFLESIQFKDLTLADLLRPTPHRVLEVLSALINFLFYREEKLSLLHSIVSEAPDYHQRTIELKARIAQFQKEIADHELAEQMVQQL